MTVLVQDTDLTIHVGDVREVLPTLPAESVDAIVTSPPYADARPDIGGPEASAFVDWITPILADLLRVTAPTGSMMLNLGRVFRDYREHQYPYETLAAARSVGWQHAETIIWHKPNGLPYSGPYLVGRHEYVWWLAKDARAAYRGFDETRQPHAAETLARYQRRWESDRKGQKGQVRRRRGGLHPDGARAGSVFTCWVGEEKGNPHPAPMPLSLASHLVALACPRGGLVLDPFAGSGTTAAAARSLSRRSVLIEFNPEYAAMAADRLSQLSLLAEGAA